MTEEGCPYGGKPVLDFVGSSYRSGGIMVVGEAPGATEARLNEPFVGDSGRFLNALLELAGISREDCYITNVCRCRPPGNKLTKKGLKFHAPFFDEVLKQAKPMMVIAVGAPALAYFRAKPSLTACHGKPFLWRGMAVFPTFHPAYAMRKHTIWPLLYADFQALGSSGVVEKVPTHYRLGTHEEARQKAECGRIGFDLETTDELHEGVFYPHLQRILGYSVSWAAGESMFVEGPPTPLADILQGEVVKVCHNAKFEYQLLLNYGIEMRNFEDTKLKAYLLQYQSTHLKDLSWQVLDVEQRRLEEVTKGRKTSEVKVEEWVDYAAADADLTLRLDGVLSKRLNEEGLEEVYERFELPLIPILARAERRGVCVKGLEREADILRGEIEEEEGRIRGVLGGVRNLNSRQQVAEGLRGIGVRLREKTSTGKWKMSKSSVERLSEQSEVVGMLQRYWKMRDFLSDFVEKLPRIAVNGVIHTSINQAGGWEEGGGESKESPATGRLSSSKPNLMQIPKRDEGMSKRVRGCFVARPGYVLMSADISQEEARIMAAVSGEEKMMEEFGRGDDVYVPIAEALKGGRLAEKEERSKWGVSYRFLAKTAFLAWQYLASGKRLVEAFPGLTMDAARGIMQKLDAAYPGIHLYHKRIEKEVKATGWVSTMWGRKRWLPGVWANDPHALRQAVNHPVQGTGADVLKGSVIWLDGELAPFDAHFLFPVYDEVVLEVKEEEVEEVKGVVERMTEWTGMVLPVEVRCGRTWS